MLLCIVRYVFDYHAPEVFFCTADIGWVTGHSYITYGPLATGATSVIVSLYIHWIRIRKIVGLKLLKCMVNSIQHNLFVYRDYVGSR